ncbi:MAG: hypothetical protein K0U37_07050 [Gammaproteobacteria bacterium]|nr:hypothetical protein [Gammaproteobacteria bacterium]
MIKETGECVSPEDDVYKIGHKHVLFRGLDTYQVITLSAKTQGRYLFYSGKAVLPQEHIFTCGIKNNKAYILRDGKHIPVYTKDNFRRFIFLYPDGTHVPPRTPLELTVEGDVFTEINGESVLLKRQQVSKKNTLPLFSNIVEPLVASCKTKRKASLVFDDENERDEETVEQDIEVTSDAIAQKAENQLTPEEIHERCLVIKATGERVSPEANVYKIGYTYVLFQGSDTDHGIPLSVKRHGKYLFYSGEAVLLQDQVLTCGCKNNRAYIERDGKYIPVYTQANLRRFKFLYPDGTPVPQNTPLELTGEGTVFTERSGERVFLKRQRESSKNALLLSSNAADPSIAPCEGQGAASSLYDDRNEENIIPSRMIEEPENTFSAEALHLFPGLVESLSSPTEYDSDEPEEGDAEDILEEDIAVTFSATPKEAEKKLTSYEIHKLSFLVRETGERVPDEADVYKIGRRYRWRQGTESWQVIARETKTQGRYLFYSGEAVLAQEQILGSGNKHHAAYIQRDGKKIPVYRKNNLIKFIFLYPDGMPVPPEIPLELVGKVQVFAERNGEQVLLIRQRTPHKNTLPMFSNIIEPLVPCHKRKKVVEAENEGSRTPSGTIEEPEKVFSPGTLSLFADASILGAIESTERAWGEDISAAEAFEI